jgi:hypothetical protein
VRSVPAARGRTAGTLRVRLQLDPSLTCPGARPPR